MAREEDEGRPQFRSVGFDRVDSSLGIGGPHEEGPYWQGCSIPTNVPNSPKWYQHGKYKKKRKKKRKKKKKPGETAPG